MSSFIFNQKEKLEEENKSFLEISKKLLSKEKYSKEEEKEILNLISLFEEANMLSKDILEKQNILQKQKKNF